MCKNLHRLKSHLEGDSALKSSIRDTMHRHFKLHLACCAVLEDAPGLFLGGAPFLFPNLFSKKKISASTASVSIGAQHRLPDVPETRVISHA